MPTVLRWRFLLAERTYSGDFALTRCRRFRRFRFFRVASPLEQLYFIMVLVLCQHLFKTFFLKWGGLITSVSVGCSQRQLWSQRTVLSPPRFLILLYHRAFRLSRFFWNFFSFPSAGIEPAEGRLPTYSRLEQNFWCEWVRMFESA